MENEDKVVASLSISDRGPIHWAWNELSVRILNVMMDELGVAEAISSLKPRMIYSGRALARNLASRFNLTGDMEMIASVPFCVRTLTWGGRGKSTLTYYERGAVIQIATCPVSHGRPEMCIVYSHYVGEGACDEINPNYELIYTHHLIQGDPSCIGICRRKGEPGDDAEHLGRKLRAVTTFDIDDKEMDALSFNVEVHGIAIFVESFIGHSSQERVQELLFPVFQEVGQEAGRRLLKKDSGQLQTIDPQILLMTWGEMLGHEIELKRDGNALELMISNCMCSSSQMLVCTLIEATLGSMLSVVCPEASISFTKAKEVSLGPCTIVCHRRVPRSEAYDDPLKLLKFRLVKGEISEDEYRSKRELLLER